MSEIAKFQPKPKGAMSAYAYFVQVIREEHKRKHPGEHVVFSEFSKKCAEKWKMMTNKEKKRFQEMANNDKQRYDKELVRTVPKDGDETSSTANTAPVPVPVKRRRKRRKIKEPGQPKRAWSAFFFFCNEHRPRIRELHPDWKVGNVAKELGRLWEGCKDKHKYERQSEADKQRYEEQMSQYRKGEYVPPVKRPMPDGEEDESDDDDDDEASTSQMKDENGYPIPGPDSNNVTIIVDGIIHGGGANSAASNMIMPPTLSSDISANMIGIPVNGASTLINHTNQPTGK